MEWLNYHHLLYFWTVVRTGSMTRASEELRLAVPTISAQIRNLERTLGEELLVRSGRRVVPTEVGRLAYSYADEIFGMGREFLSALKEQPTGRPMRVVIGVADVLPKLVAQRLIEPALRLPQRVRIVCRETGLQHLLAQLAVHEIDVTLSDAPFDPGLKIRAFNHLLGECGVVFAGTAKLAKALQRGFPRSLDGAPMLLPTENTGLRRNLDLWFESKGIRPSIVGEFEDYALLSAFGETGAGVFPAPAVIERQLRRLYRVRAIGRTDDVRSRFYAISVERKLKHPAVVAICEAARRELFV
ncbi:MAG TPA: transcriptional activator NhaR [Terriglobia bacterium]|nr:transcriptional activator NhaR [Terriglobia bacterium]